MDDGDGDGGEREGSGLSRWLRAWAPAIAPVSILSALLFYFGYVSSRAQYEYFGLDVDTIGLGTQDYIMRSPQPLLVPLLLLTLLGAGGLLLHAVIHRRITNMGLPLHRIRRLISAAKVTGAVVLAAAIVLLFAYGLVREWAAYSLVTPLLVITGGGLAAYAWRLSDLIGEAPTDGPATSTPAHADPGAMLRRAGRFMIYVLIVTAVFWATATVAQWSGRGQARDTAVHLDRLPRVILDTKERLYLRSLVVEESRLPDAEGQTFRYRYRRLRLLVIGRDRMFLVPEVWSAGNSTLITPIDSSARIQFQFQNDVP
jgi:hypothetical protein